LDITFILVNPAVPENIGATARAINTMGFTNLTLVNPPTDFMEKARILAHGSVKILDQASKFHSFEEAISEFDFLIATSSKRRRTNEEYVPATNLYEFLYQKKLHLNRIAIVFGREESGLSNREIRRCDLVTYIPLIHPYPSLNLSHAVMIYAYLLSGFSDIELRSTKIQSISSLRVLKEKVTTILEELELKQAHIIGPRIFEKISLLTDEDISLLHSICNAYMEKRKFKA